MLTAIQQPLCSFLRSRANGGTGFKLNRGAENGETGRDLSIRCGLTSQSIKAGKNYCMEGDSTLRFDHFIHRLLQTLLGKMGYEMRATCGHVGEGVCRIKSQSP